MSAAAIVLAVALAVVAVGPYLPARMARAAVVPAIVLAAIIWLAEGLGGLFTGGGTDLNSGPLLALLAESGGAASPDGCPEAGPGRPYLAPGAAQFARSRWGSPWATC